MKFFRRGIETRADEYPVEAPESQQIEAASWWSQGNSAIDQGWLKPRRIYRGLSDSKFTGACEMAASWWSRALASATVTGDMYGVVDAPMLAQVGRALIREGEWLGLIQVRGGKVVLIPAAAQWSEGDCDPERLEYRVTVNGPSTSRVIRAPASQIVHLMWSSEPARPWRGQSPLELASQTARRAWATEYRLADLAAAPVKPAGIVVLKGASDNTVEQFADMHDDKDWDGDATIDVTNAEASYVSVTGGGMAPSPPDIQNAMDVRQTLASACGIPVVLVSGGGEGSAAVREAFRVFLFSAVAPIAETLLVELRRKLDAPDLAFSFEELRAADITGRARAYGSLIKAGYPVDLAATTCGLPIPPAPTAAASAPVVAPEADA